MEIQHERIGEKARNQQGFADFAQDQVVASRQNGKKWHVRGLSSKRIPCRAEFFSVFAFHVQGADQSLKEKSAE